MVKKGNGTPLSEALIRQFVDVLYPPETRAGLGPEPFLTISVADPKNKTGPLRSYHFRISDPELEIAAEHLDGQGLNVYHGVGLHAADLGPVRGKKADITALPGFWVDIDIAGPGHVAQDLPPSIADVAEHVLAKFDFEPSIAVATGGGLHLYWLFDKPIAVTDANRDELGKLSKTFQERLGALAKAAPGGPWRIDGTADITRILRPVGTHNHKTSLPEPLPVEWLYPPEGCVRYPFAVLRSFLTVANTTAAKTGAGLFASRPAKPSIADAVADAEVPPAPPASALSEEWTHEKTTEHVQAKIKANKKDERREIFKAITAGKPFAKPGERDSTLQRVASWLAFYCPDGDPEAITDLLVPSLDAMEAESPGDFLTYEQALSKVMRAQGDARAKEAVRKESEARLMGTLFGEGRGAAGREKAAALEAARAPRAVPTEAKAPAPAKIPETTPPAAAALDATSAAGDGSEPTSSGAAGTGVVPGGSGLAVVPGDESPGRAVSETYNPFAPRASTALAIVPASSDVAPTETDGPKTHYTGTEIDDFCAQQTELSKVTVDPLTFKKRFLIQRDEAFFVYKLSPATGKPGYCSPIRRGELPASLTRDLLLLPEVLPHPSGDPEKNIPYFSWNAMKADGAVRRKTTAEIIDELCTSARDSVADMTIPASYYDPSTETFYEATCPVRDLKPEYSPEVATWLELLAGPEIEKVLDWIASITYLESPTCALFIYGKSSAGKSMLAHGLARLWTSGSPTKMGDANGSFNADIARCPLVVADEYLPLDSNGKPMSTKKLREMIGDREHVLRRKFMANSTLRGAIRAMFLANNEDMLSQNDESLGPDSLEAVAQRFLYVEAGEAAAEFLKSRGGNRGTRDWVDGDRIARHALWLRDARKIERDYSGRFLVEGHITRAHNALATSGAVPGLVVEWLARFLVAPREDLIRQHDVIIGEGRYLVSASGLLKNWSFVVGDQHKAPNLQRINKVLAGLSPKKVQVREQRTSGAGATHRGRYWEVKPEVVIDYAEREGLAKGDASELWDRIKGPEVEFKGGGVFGK